MDRNQEERLDRVLDAALDLEGDERNRFLDRECADDPAMRQALEAHLHHESVLEGEFLKRPAFEQAIASEALRSAGKSEPSPTNGPAALGPYRIFETLGEGGMATVYRAVQEEPYHRDVALKVVYGGYSRAIRYRFEAERRALARLSHPNIATLYDTGTDEGAFYIAMEWVDGSPVTTWCDEHRLGVAARLRLFLDVCAAVGHAHEKSILHRDIKPTNVLVTEIDGQPVAKVIDFGIARAISGGRSLVDTQLTLHGQVLGSPAYLSPEAASGNPDIDVRSDVHGLGLLLFELLAGIPASETSDQSLSDVLRRMAEDDLPTMTARFKAQEGDVRRVLATKRRLTPETLARLLKDDLGAIVSKATARDRAHRYRSALELVADLERFLSYQPVTARAPSAGYVARRFLRRHRAWVLASAAVVLALLGGLVARTIEVQKTKKAALQARVEADRARAALTEAREVSRFVIDLFRVADPESESAGALSAREMLDRASEDLHSGLDQQPLARARFLHSLGTIYTNLAEDEQAEPLIQESLKLRREHLPAETSEIADSLSQLGILQRRSERFEDSRANLSKALELRLAEDPRDPRALALAYNHLGNLEWAEKKWSAAAAAHREALALRRRHQADDIAAIAESLNNLGVALRFDGRFTESEPILREAIEKFGRAFGARHPRVAAGYNNLAPLLRLFNRWGEAEVITRRALGIWLEVYGSAHPRTQIARRNLVSLLAQLHRCSESIALSRDLLAASLERFPEDHPKVGASWLTLGSRLVRCDAFEEAQSALERGLEIYTTQDHDWGANRARNSLALLAQLRGDLTTAEELARRVHSERSERYGPRHSLSAASGYRLATILIEQGRLVEAEGLLREARAIRLEQPAHSNTVRLALSSTNHALAKALTLLGRNSEARTYLEEALAIREAQLPEGHPDLADTRQALGQLTAGSDSPHVRGVTEIDGVRVTLIDGRRPHSVFVNR